MMLAKVMHHVLKPSQVLRSDCMPVDSASWYLKQKLMDTRQQGGTRCLSALTLTRRQEFDWLISSGA
jgi:hypothetical protein